MPNPRTAAAWAKMATGGCVAHGAQGNELACEDCIVEVLGEYAREQVEAFRERPPFEAYGCWLRSWVYWVGARCRDGCHRKEFRITAEQLAEATYADKLWSYLEATMFADLAVAHMRDAAAIRAGRGT